MEETSNKARTELEQNVERLRALREDVRRNVHLAKQDVKDRWRDLEPNLTSIVDQAAKSASEVSRAAVTEAIKALEKLRASLP